MAQYSRSSKPFFLHLVLFLLLTAAGVSPRPAFSQERQTLTFSDLMKVRQIQSPAISPHGRWIAMTAMPDRGDGELLVYGADSETSYSIPMASNPTFSQDGKWVGARLLPSFEARETAKAGDAPKPGMALLATATGEVRSWENVQSFAFSGDGKWMARLHHAAPKGDAEAEAGGQEMKMEEGTDPQRTRKDPGTLLVLLSLDTGAEVEIPDVKSFSFHPQEALLAYVVATPDGQGDGIFLRELDGGSEPQALETGTFLDIRTVAWWKEGRRLAWVMAEEDQDGEAGPGTLSIWKDGEVTAVSLDDALSEGWGLPVRNRLQWSSDGERLFYGARPDVIKEEVVEAEDEDVPFDPYDFDRILEGRGVDVWNTDDPFINPNQKVMWSRLQSRTYAGVYHLATGAAVQLEDEGFQLRGFPDNSSYALGSSDLPYRKESTWTGGAEDLYLVALDSGKRTLVVKGFTGGSSAANSWIGAYAPSVSLSPEGRYVVWFKADHWHLFDAETGESRNLTQGLDVAFFDVDNDYPAPRGGHGIGGWMKGDAAVLIHDKFDVWRFPTDGGRPVNLTEGKGRAQETVLRVQKVDPDVEAYDRNATLLLYAFNWEDKGFGFYSTRADRGGLTPLLEGDKKFSIVAKADDADRLLFTQEDYDEFPDLWVGDMEFGHRRKVSDVNPGLLDRFAWGTSHLVEWTSDDGIPLQGVMILPGNYEEGKRYPVLTYFYRFFSQRLHEFNQPVINHRPSFPIYASDGYIVFLPDVRFEVGRPGISSLKSVVPGVKKLVDLGYANPNALGLHGHSWSGYTTAYMVTQTNIFAAAVAGAPVSNMTSAYGGIRWGSGLARQFQYEQTQSRLSGSLWDALPDYIENSPLFYADRVETPLVLMHGDEDDAVPWYQSIELYLALRRTGKKAVFLQYRGEPHHPQKYGNKLDYSIKMKEFFDHFLKGAPAPEWWTVGVPYNGK